MVIDFGDFKIVKKELLNNLILALFNKTPHVGVGSEITDRDNNVYWRLRLQVKYGFGFCRCKIKADCQKFSVNSFKYRKPIILANGMLLII